MLKLQIWIFGDLTSGFTFKIQQSFIFSAEWLWLIFDKALDPSRYATNYPEQILAVHTTLNTWPLTQPAAPHTTSHRRLDGHEKANASRASHKSRAFVFPLNVSQLQRGPSCHYRTAVIMTVIICHRLYLSLCSPFSPKRERGTICRRSGSDHKLALVPIKASKLLPLFLVRRLPELV